ncbi:MAG: PepSY-associated TM helix domain-containing protein [Pseudomonadota bacterium]
MDRDRRVRVYDAHSWTGISLGIILFVVCFTGSLAMFDHEIQSWEDPARRLAPTDNPIPVQPLMSQFMDEFGEPEAITFVGMTYPSAYEPYYQGRVNVRTEDGFDFHSRKWDPATGEVLPSRGDGLSTWILDFHRDLMWPTALGGRTVGGGLVGIFGIVMMLSIITGILTHKKILKEFFQFRVDKSVRVKWKDAHNFLGVWTLPFSIVMAFTGAWLGVVALMLPATGALVFKGNAEQVIETIQGPPIERTGVAATMISLDEIADRPHSDSGAMPVSVFISRWGDETAEYAVNYLPDTELMYYEQEKISGVTGALLPLTGLDAPSPETRVVAAVSPLHYGTYGGISLKFLYFLLGIGLSAMVALGNMVWVERRANSSEGKRSPQFYERLARLTVGGCLGVVLASVAIFYADVYYTGDEQTRIVYIGQWYFAVWFAVLTYAMLIRNSYQSTRHILAATGVGLLGLPIVSAMQAGEMPWHTLAAGHAASPFVDLTLFVLGIICLAVTWKLPKERKARPARRTRPSKHQESVDTAIAQTG